MSTYICDLEADGLLNKATRIWCIVARDYDTDEVFTFKPHQIKEGLKFLSEADKTVWHNGILFDIPLIQKLDSSFTYKDIDDTFILSSLFNPDRPIPPGAKGGHSIEAWGIRFGVAKPKHEDWSKYSDEMLHRCIKDTRIGKLTYQYLQEERNKWDWELAIKIEYTIAKLQAEQERVGIVFDKRGAISLWIKIVKELQEIDKKLLLQLPLRCVAVNGEVKKPFKGDGSYANSVHSWFAGHEDYLTSKKVCGPFSRVQFEEFNLNSDTQIKEYLLSQGWQPDEWNYKKDGKRWAYGDDGQKIKTSPKITESSLVNINSGLAQVLARRNILTHRKGLLYSYSKSERKPLGWLTHIRKDNTIAAQAVPMACNTGRMRHSVVVNCPKASPKIVYGSELRELFTVPDGYVLVGCDAKALEARTEAHNCLPYTGGKEYAKELLERDIHSKNAVLFGTDRDGAKSTKYGATYGASSAKIAEILGCSIKRGTEIHTAFWEGNTALKEFKDAVIAEFKHNKKKYGSGFIVGLDGRKLIGRSEHSLVNLKFQSDGAILMKAAWCFLFNKWIPLIGLRAYKVLDFHDEVQAMVHRDDVEQYSALALQAVEAAGKFFKYRVPILGDVKSGLNWSQTH